MGATLKLGGRTLAVAESLTGGMLASAFARASGASDWFRGGSVAYSSAVKHDLLDVPDGPVVSEAAAAAMARGTARLFKADVAAAVTGSVAQSPKTASLRARCGPLPGPVNWAGQSCSVWLVHRKASASKHARR